MNSNQIYRFSGKLFFLLILLAQPLINIKAQSDSIKRPFVGDHFFTPVTQSNLPFTNTYFYTLTGFGQTLDMVHQLELIGGDRIIGLQGEVTFVDMRFAYQQRVRDWLAAYITLNVSARIGTELQSILTQGINTINGFEIGWHIKLLETEKIALSTNVELQNLQGNFINVPGFVNDIINDHPNPSLNETVPVLAFSTGLRFAWGFSDLVGVKASTIIAYGETYNRGENGFALSAGAGVDFDFYPRYSLPVGLVLHYNISSMPDIVYFNNEYAHVLQAKIAYSKASDFSLGIELSYMKVPLINQEKHPGVYSIALAARYYF